MHGKSVRVEGGEWAVSSMMAPKCAASRRRGDRPARTPHDLGLETVGIEPSRRGIEIDEHCKAADGVGPLAT